VYKKIGVLLGGLSAESEVSKDSGKNACKALDNLGLNYVCINPKDGLIEQLEKHKPDVILNMLHGTYGEDGCIPGLLELMEIPYTHSGVLASAVGMNKEFTKKILADTPIKMAKSLKVNVDETIHNIRQGKHPLPLPYVLKPLDQGSTVGIFMVDENFNPDVLSDWEFGDYIMAEEYIGGIELTTGVLNGEALVTIEVELLSATGIQEYSDKYTVGAAKHVFPPQMAEDDYKLAQEWAVIAHEKLGCRTTSRTDFKYDAAKPEGERLVFLETNTHPGFTVTSNIPDILKFAGKSCEEYIVELLNSARCDLNQRGADVYPQVKIQKG